jgi:hypothetical protein
MSKPNRILMPSDESQDDSQSEQEARKAFIKGPKIIEPEPEPEPVIEPVEYKRKPANIRFDPAILDRIDFVAKRRGMSRSSYIHYICSEALKAEGV